MPEGETNTGDQTAQGQSQQLPLAQTQGSDKSASERAIDPAYHDRVLRERNDAQAQLRQLQNEAEERKRQELAQQGKDKERADLAEQQAREKIADSDKKIAAFREYAITGALKAKAVALGLRNPDDVQFITRDGITFDEATGAISGDDAALTAFKEARPYMFNDFGQQVEQQKKDDRRGTFVPPGDSGGATEPVDAFKMSKEQFSAEAAKRFRIAVRGR